MAQLTRFMEVGENNFKRSSFVSGMIKIAKTWLATVKGIECLS